jgi:hypothetical protein
MNVNNFSLCHEIESDYFRNEYNRKIESIPSNQENDTWLKLMKIEHNLINLDSTRKLIFSGRTKENLKNYFVPKEIRVPVLQSLPERFDTIQYDECHCFKYIKSEHGIFVLSVFRNEKLTKSNILDVDNHLCILVVDFKTGLPFITGGTPKGSIKTVSEYIEEIYSKFIISVTYLELTNVTLSIVDGKTKVGSIMKNNILRNDSPFKVIQVNSNWTNEKIVVGQFSVRGHKRLQRVGKGLCTFKWVDVSPYTKDLVHRQSQKELVN